MSQATHDAALSRIVGGRCQQKRIRTENADQVEQVLRRRFGRLLDVVEVFGTVETITATGAGNELPEAAGIGPAARQRIEAAFDQGHITLLERDLFGREDFADGRPVFVFAQVRTFVELALFVLVILDVVVHLVDEDLEIGRFRLGIAERGEDAARLAFDVVPLFQRGAVLLELVLLELFGERFEVDPAQVAAEGAVEHGEAPLLQGLRQPGLEQGDARVVQIFAGGQPLALAVLLDAVLRPGQSLLERGAGVARRVDRFEQVSTFRRFGFFGRNVFGPSHFGRYGDAFRRQVAGLSRGGTGDGTVAHVLRQGFGRVGQCRKAEQETE